MVRSKFITLLLILISIINIAISKQFTEVDLHKMKRMSSPAVSLDSKYIVFSVRLWDEKTGKVSNHLEYTEIATGKTNNLTDPNLGKSDSNPIFNSDFPNIITFVSNRSGSSQVWYMRFPPRKEYETPIQLTEYPLGVENVKFVKKSLVFSVEVYFDCVEDVLTCTNKRNSEIALRGSNTWGVYTKLMVRHWDRWLEEGKGYHLMLQRISSVTVDDITVPKVDQSIVDLMKGMEANSPVPPNGGAEQYDIKSDGSEVAFTAHLRTVDEAWSTGWKVFVTNINIMTSPLHLTSNIKARVQNPRYSPDGTRISYLAMNRVGLESDNLHLEIYDRLSNRVDKITDFFDNSVIDYSWYDGNTILFTTQDLNRNKVFMIDITNPTNTLTRLTDDAYSYGLPMTVNYMKGKLVVKRGNWATPDELAVFDFDLRNRKINSNIIRLVNINQEFMSNFIFEDMESFLFTGGLNDKVQGWILKPANYQEGKTYPLAFLIHGGPEGGWKSSWGYGWNPQVWAHRGYAVVMINPHGSIGQGIKFQDAVRDDWGGVPYEDLMTGLDYVLATYKYIDADRMCAAGASYGGYMVNWIQGHTDRFKCLATHDGVFSTLSMFYSTEEVWFPYAEYCPRDKLGCNPFDSQFRDRYLKFSPEAYVQNWKTPHLVIHGTNDYRIDISEGLSVFTALQVKGIKSRFLHFPQENHWVLKTENSIKWFQEVIGWMDQFTNTTTANTTDTLSLKFLTENY